MFTWAIKQHLARLGITNAHELAVRAGLSYPVANRIWKNTPVARVDAETVRKLALCFGVKRPMTLVELDTEGE